MLCGVEPIDVLDEQILLAEFLQVNDQGVRRAVEISCAVEECATYRTDEGAGKSG